MHLYSRDHLALHRRTGVEEEYQQSSPDSASGNLFLGKFYNEITPAQETPGLPLAKMDLGS